MEYVPEKLLEMDESEIASTIEIMWNKTKELQEATAAITKHYDIAFVMILVVGFIVWFLGGSHLIVFALFTFSALIKIYGLIKVTRFELNIAMNNQYVTQFTVAGMAKKILAHTSNRTTLKDEI